MGSILQASVLEICLVNGDLVLYLGSTNPLYCGVVCDDFISNYWMKRPCLNLLLKHNYSLHCCMNRLPTHVWLYLLQTISTSDFDKVCVTFNNGTYTVYYNGAFLKTVEGDPMPTNSQSATALGTAYDYPSFEGYLDDVCCCLCFSPKLTSFTMPRSSLLSFSSANIDPFHCDYSLFLQRQKTKSSKPRNYQHWCVTYLKWNYWHFQFCFWTEVMDASFIQQCYNNGVSNNY